MMMLNGGGLLKLNANQVILDGQIIADGGSVNRNNRHGGSGGGVHIETNIIEGTGLITVRGAGHDKALENNMVSGGGRISVYANDWSGFILNNEFFNRVETGTDFKPCLKYSWWIRYRFL